MQERAKAEAEERELRSIPKPEKPEDVTVEEREVTFYTTDGDSHTERYIGLYCKEKPVDTYETRTEAEAARLQFLHDNGVENTEDFTLYAANRQGKSTQQTAGLSVMCHAKKILFFLLFSILIV